MELVYIISEMQNTLKTFVASSNILKSIYFPLDIYEYCKTWKCTEWITLKKKND